MGKFAVIDAESNRADQVMSIGTVIAEADTFAYNACFDRNHLPELRDFDWYNIMHLAAYHQYNAKIGYFSEDNKLSYYFWFNTLKQEFNIASYFLYLVEKDLAGIDPHESKTGILLISSLDYPAIGYRSELIKTSLKTAYGILDKVGMLCSDLVHVEKSENIWNSI